MSEHAPQAPTPLEQEAERLAAAAFMGTSPNPEQDMQTALDTRRMLNERPATATEAAAAEDHYDKTMGPDQRNLDQKAKAADLVNQWVMADLRQDPTRAYEIREELERRSFKGLVTDRGTNQTNLGPYADKFHSAANRMDALFDRKERIKGMIIDKLSPPPAPEAIPNRDPRMEDAETQEIPTVVDEGAKLAPEVDFRDLRDVNGTGLKFTEMIARRNALGGRLPAGEEKQFQEIREELNGVYPSEKKIEENTALTAEQKAEQKAKLTADLTAKAKELGITLPELTRRLGKFEATQAEYKRLGLPTYEDKLPLTGDKLYSMFSADSKLSKYYVGEGGLTPKMQKILVELTKNKGTDVKWFERNGLTFSLVPKAADKKRAKEIAKMVADVNAERKVTVEWVKNKETGKFEPKTGGGAKERGVGDILLQQFMGNREVSTNTRGARAGRWIGRNLLRREIPDYQPLPNGGESRTTSRNRRMGRLATRMAGLGPQGESQISIPTINEVGTSEEIAQRRARFAAREAEYAAARASRGPVGPEGNDNTTA